MNISIDKGIPIPPHEPGRRKMYPFDRMEVGDSFFVATSEPGNLSLDDATKRLAKNLGTAAYCWATHHGNGRRFVVRIVGQGARVWRVQDASTPPEPGGPKR